LSRPELRVQVAADNLRVPYLTILSRNAPREQIITHPPARRLRDSLARRHHARMLENLADYEPVGIAAIWVIEPKKTSYFSVSERTARACSRVRTAGNRMQRADGGDCRVD
jgi:hypothetical protein